MLHDVEMDDIGAKVIRVQTTSKPHHAHAASMTLAQHLFGRMPRTLGRQRVIPTSGSIKDRPGRASGLIIPYKDPNKGLLRTILECSSAFLGKVMDSMLQDCWRSLPPLPGVEGP